MVSSSPRYLQGYESQWNCSPRLANLNWFQNAAFGLFIHYGLYSQLGRKEWVQYNEKIPVSKYEQLYDSFNPSHFDADFITDLALDAGMRYVTFTSCHHEGFCLWNSSVEMFNSYRAVKRDLVRELAEQCDEKGLGFFTYFTYALNWRHPYSITRDIFPMARPAYDFDEKRYSLTSVDEYRYFWDWSLACLKELCAIEYPLAGIWLDIIIAFYQQPRLVPVAETYEMIRSIRPEVLIAFKQGATGTEDFASPEFHFASLSHKLRAMGCEEGAQLADYAWQKNQHKHNEICMTLQDHGWGYDETATHKSADVVWKNLAYAQAHNCNLLANVGPLPDGSIHPDDVACLKEVGRRIRKFGFPDLSEACIPEYSEGAGAM